MKQHQTAGRQLLLSVQIALEAKSGQVLWESRRADYKDQVAQTTGPIVVKGKLLNVRGERSLPESPARPESSGRWMPGPESSCGQGRRSTRTS